MNSLQKFKDIKVFVFDIDGVLTDGSLLVLPNGVMARTMNVKDGYAMQLAVKKGFKVLIISGGYSVELIERFKLLGITEVHLKVLDKLAVLKNYLKQFDISSSEVLFMGDDMPDIEIMEFVGLACCPSDAVQEVKNISVYISPINGGKGCARDVIEKTMKLNSQWNHENHIAAK